MERNMMTNGQKMYTRKIWRNMKYLDYQNHPIGQLLSWRSSFYLMPAEPWLPFLALAHQISFLLLTKWRYKRTKDSFTSDLLQGKNSKLMVESRTCLIRLSFTQWELKHNESDSHFWIGFNTDKGGQSHGLG